MKKKTRYGAQTTAAAINSKVMRLRRYQLLRWQFRVAFAAVVLVVAGTAAATADVFEHPLNAETEAVFEDVRAALAVNAVQKGDFTQTKTIARLKRDLVSSGSYLISHDDGIVWQTKKPYQSTLIVTKRAVVQIAASGKKSVLQTGNNATFESFSAVISSVFSGGDALNARNFDIYFEGTREQWTVGVMPKDSTIAAVAMDFVLQGVAGTLSSVTMHEPSGDSVRYDFTAVRYADTLTAEERALFND